MEISNNTFIEFKNNSTIKTIQTDIKSMRSSLFEGFIKGLNLSVWQKEWIKMMLQIKENDNMKTLNDSILATYAALTSSGSSTTDATPKTIKILDLWKLKRFEQVSDTYEETTEELYNNDFLYKSLLEIVEQMVDKITQEYPDVLKENKTNKEDMSLAILEQIGKLPIYSKNTRKKADEAYQVYTKERRQTAVLYDEIKTMLSACDTYEQEMSVLKSYGVVDNSGKLNVSTV